MEEILFGGHAYAFYKAIEKAKMDLSSAPQTSIEFHRPFLDLSVSLTRSELDRMLSQDLAIVMSQIEAALEKAGVKVTDVNTVLRTGGSSLLAPFVERLEMLFGSESRYRR